MPSEAARKPRAEDDAVATRSRLRAVPDAPAHAPRRRRRARPARAWDEFEWSSSPAASPGGGDRPRRDVPPVGERVDDPFAVEPLRGDRSGTADVPPPQDPAPRRRREDPPPGRRTIQITGQATPPRRRAPAAAQISSRPDRVALWAVVLGLFLVFMAAATARAEWSHATLGERTLGKGDRGSDVVTLQRVLRMKGYRISIDGIFGRGTKRTVKRFQRRRRLQADGRVGPLTTRALAATWTPRTATIFGPGLYGNRTACGQTLAHRTRGLAHRGLACGRKVAVYHAGRIVVLPVIDRGPFTNGVSFDVTEAAGRKLGMSTTSTIRAGY